MSEFSLSARPLRAALLSLALVPALANAQDRLQTMPGYDNVTKMRPVYSQNLMVRGAIDNNSAVWAPDGKSLDYRFGGRPFRFDYTSKKVTELAATPGDAPAPGGRNGFPGGGGNTPGGGRNGGPGAGMASCGVSTVVERGRQAERAVAPDAAHQALYKNRNVFIANADCSGEVAVTLDGNEATKIKYGTGSWVYGEELNQPTAMWWNRASNKLGYYRFDESKVKPFFLALNQSDVNTALDAEAYPKAGADNPLADIYIYDLAAKKSVRMDVRDGKPNVDATVGYYVYGVKWSPDDKELLVTRANRLQNVVEMVGCAPDTGKCRLILHEEWPTGWVDENTPQMTYLKDNNRFVLRSERNGFANFYLHDLSGKQINQITNHQFEVVNIVRIDEAANALWYMARDGDNFMKLQLHRVGLDGKGDVRLTDPAFNHTITLAPDGKSYLDLAQTHDQPPVTRLMDAQGKPVAELVKSDISKPEAVGMKKIEMFTFLAADGKTTLYGTIAKPVNFDPAKKYPVILDVYGGPGAANTVPTETFGYSSINTEYGFITVLLHTRATPGMGKRVLDAVYLKLGQTEIDDMAAGIKELAKRSYINKDRVGIAGTSYGGYSSAMALLRYPDVFHSAVAQSAVTAWDNYDTIYTERYMSTPQLNKDGYVKGSAMTYAANLTGRLMIYFGSADNNVHPNNAMQLISALQQAGKSFEVQVGPDEGHSAVNNARKWEFLIQTLVLGQ